MPHENRQIIFDFSEVYKAIFALCVQKKLPPPVAGRITAIHVKGDDGQGVIISFANDLEATSATREFSRDFLAAALMLYCRSCRIPIPKKALKSVEIGADAVTLHITL